MPALDNLFATVENYEKINIQYLSFSKIGKVMRHIAVLTEDKVPRDAEFHFRDRAKALVDKWHQILNANKPNGAESSAPMANGKGDEGDKGANPGSDIPKEHAIPQASEKEMAPLSAPQVEDQSMEVDTSGAEGADAKDAPGSPAPAQGGGDVSPPAEVAMAEA